MKKLIFTLLLLPFALWVNGQGNEDFANYPETQNSYHDGTFIGQDGSTWTYWQCRGDSVIVAPSPTLGKNRTPTAEVISGTLQNGCGTLSFQYKQVFSTNVNLDVFVNGLLVHTATTNGEQGVVKNTGNIAVNISGDFTLDFKQKDNNAGQVCIDNIIWTAHSGSILPEPSNYPTSFLAVPGSYTIVLNWLDAAGTQPPIAYLIKGSTQNNVASPVDGTPVPDDPDLADGSGSLNILQGVGTCAFANLNSNTPYYFKIFPYTNSGTNINYKTDGTAPSANATTPNTVVLNSEDFNDFTFGDWWEYNVLGDEIWMIDSLHGVSGTGCAKVSGFSSGSSHQNEDWLISPPLDFNSYQNENLTFMNATKYTGAPMEVLISNEYDGQGEPGNFDWTTLTATLSPGNWTWTASGDVDVSGILGEEVYIAFKYTSTDTESATWEVDDIVITGDFPTGIVPAKERLSVTVSPNPSHGRISVLTGQPGVKHIEIVSLIGTTIYRTTTGLRSTSIDLGEIPSGLYLVKVTNEENSQYVITRLIVY